LTRFPTTRRAEWANFRVGLCLFKDSNFAAAAQAFGAYRQEKSSSVQPAGMLWEAKSLERMNQVKAADSLRMVVYLNYPCSFYGHLARELLDRDAAIPDSLQPWNRFHSSRPERIKEWMQAKIPGFKDVLDKSYESAYLDLSQLLELHQDTLALLTMHSTPAKVKRNPWYLFIHARRFQRYDMHPEAYKLARALVQLIPNEDLGTAPKEILRLIWPRPYEAEVLHYAIKRNLDPALLFALMRQESGFDRDIRSGAGAIGLMQLMPATAKAQAELDSLKDFHAQDLNQSEINVRLGTFYVRTLLDTYGNNPFFMLANYNAGPEPTRRWFRAYGQKPVDEMVEEISYWETRDYLKKVMGNYWTYKILYNNRIARHSTYKANP
jgi:soluble lytic murein transglycosylase